MEASSRAHKWEGALKLLERMEQKGVPPNLIAYSSALAACERGNRWQQAAQIW